MGDRFVKIDGHKYWLLGSGVDDPGGASLFKDLCKYGR